MTSEIAHKSGVVSEKINDLVSGVDSPFLLNLIMQTILNHTSIYFTPIDYLILSSIYDSV